MSWTEKNTCNKTDVRLFVLRCRNDLSSVDKEIFDNHLNNCTDCNLNFLYVKDILEGNQSLSLDEQTLLLKYICDPLWDLASTKARERTKKEILNQLDFKSFLDEKGLTKEKIATNREYVPNNQKREVSSRSKFPLFIIFIALLLITLFSVKYFFGPIKNADVPLNLNLDKDSSLYTKLDELIYTYLLFGDPVIVERLDALAMEIKFKYKDNYATDTVKYYKTNTSKRLENLKLKEKLKKLSRFTFQNDPDVFLAELQTLEKDFLLSGNESEAYLVKSMIAMFYGLNYNLEASNSLTKNGLDFASQKDYKFLYLNFLFAQSKSLIDADRPLAKMRLSETINMAKELNANNILISCSMSLAGIYEIENKNEEALFVIQQLKLLYLAKHTTQVSCYQIAAIASHKLQKPELSDFYFSKALEIAESKQDLFLLALTYTLKANTTAEQHLFAQSDELFTKADRLSKDLLNEFRKTDIDSRILGYKAKAKMLKGDYMEAFNLYQQTLELLDELHVDKSMERAQINDALATLSLKLGRKEEDYKIAATIYRKEAKNKYQQISCVLSFMPMECN